MAWKSREWPGEPGKSAGNLAKWLEIQENGDVTNFREWTKRNDNDIKPKLKRNERNENEITTTKTKLKRNETKVKRNEIKTKWHEIKTKTKRTKRNERD